MRRLWAVTAAMLVLSPVLATLLLAAPSAAATFDAQAPVLPRTPGVPRIAVLDTGIDPSHPEFDPGQIIAWGDFTPAKSATPIDLHGHGTAVASLVAGNNRGRCGSGLAGDKLSFAPGAELVIARVGEHSSINGDVNAAIMWAIEQQVDVISMSFGPSIPFPGDPSGPVNLARGKGILTVIAAGNGVLGFGLAPAPSQIQSYANGVNTLVVGGGGRNGGTLLSTTGNIDPEITSWSDGVCVALAGGTGYGRMSGTSFSAPLVSGMAATAMELARSAGGPSYTYSATRIELIVQRSASNNVLSPYAREGLGFVLTNEWETIKSHALNGTLPNYDAQGAHAVADRLYHDQVSARLRLL